MSTPFPSRSDMIGGKKKSKKKKTIIENLPHLSSPYAGANEFSGGGIDPEGTSACPIYVSDFEDSSEVAVRGEYKYRDFVSKTLPVVARGRPQQPREEETIEFQVEPLVDAEETNKKKKRSEMKKRIAKMSKRSKSKEPVHIDMTDLYEDKGIDETPLTPEELEEIALGGRRAGLISGTPEKAAYDVENGKSKPWKKVTWGKLQKKLKKRKKNVSNFTIDDFDDEHPDVMRAKARQRMTKKVLALAVVLLSIVLMSVGISKKKKSPPKNKPLNAEQQKIQDILVKITGEKTLTEHGTPQNSARNWLFYQDRESYSSPDKSDNAIIQRFALACLYYATNGDSGKSTWEKNNWLKGPECGSQRQEAWTGVKCNSDGEILTLALDNWGLSGTIPPEVGHLYKLENLILKNNPDLTGWIPTSLSNLSSLRQLGLYNNNLSGVIPNIFEGANSLQFINLEKNNIHGVIPMEISNLASLETLVLKENQLEGLIPFKQMASTSIKYLGLSNNQFASMIERDIFDVETLEYLYLDNNKMKGTVPPHIGNLSHLKALDLGNNSFTGFFPGTVGNLEKLEYLSLNNNHFNRNLPLRISLLTNLRTFDVSSNTFTGTPPDFSDLVNLKTLHLYENDFSGPFPESLEGLKSIESLFLSSNRFTGTIPESVSLMGRTLTGLYLSDNYFEGTIPTHLCEFVGLEALFLDTNQFSGSIPACFGELSDMKQLYLFNNKLTGAVPASLQGLKQLTGFGIESNNIVGQVPDEVCGLVHHQRVEMWADCAASANALECPCCSVCCPGDQCK